jgi:hypothetical protein
VSESSAAAEWGETATRLANSTALAAAVAAVVVLPIAIAAVDNAPAGVFQDDGMYMILAKSLATGHGYRWINLPGQPPATHYPPGYPAFLSLLWRIGPAFPANVVFFKLVNALLLAAAAAVMAVFVRRRLTRSSPAACLVAIAGCAAIPVLVLSNLVMSETLFLALLLPALLYAEWYIERDAAPLRHAVGLAILGGTLMLVRSHGVAFVAAAAGMLLVRRRFRALSVYAAVVLLIAMPWHYWQSVNNGVVPLPMRGAYGSYGTWFLQGSPAHSLAFLGRTVAATSREIFAMLFVLTTSGMPALALRFFGVAIAIALLVLGLVSLRRRTPVTAAFLCLFLAIVMVWPFAPARFVWAVWPLLVMCFVAGVIAMKAWSARAPWMQAGRAIVAAGALITLVGYGTYNLRGYSGRWWSSIARAAVGLAGPTVAWVARNTAPDAVVSSNSEGMIYLYTGRLAVPATQLLPDDYFHPPTVASSARALGSILQSYRVDAVAIVANDSLDAAARRMAAGAEPLLELRDSVPGGLIFSTTSTRR